MVLLRLGSWWRYISHSQASPSSTNVKRDKTRMFCFFLLLEELSSLSISFERNKRPDRAHQQLERNKFSISHKCLTENVSGWRSMCTLSAKWMYKYMGVCTVYTLQWYNSDSTVHRALLFNLKVVNTFMQSPSAHSPARPFDKSQTNDNNNN